MILAWLISLLLLQIPSPAAQVQDDGSVIPSEAKESQEEDVDIAEIIFEHIGRAYRR